MREMMQRLLKQLLPKQKMQDLGDGNVQAGRVAGDLNHSQHSTTQHIYNTFYLVAGSEEATNDRKQPAGRENVPVATELPASAGQHEVLRLMRSSPSAKTYAEDFMQKTFGTIRVKSLNDMQCRRTKAYVEACLKNEAVKTAAVVNKNASCG
jgi:hypothetical protein